MPDVEIYLGDCVPGMRERLGDGEVDLIISSIPFGSLFTYSFKTEDVGNNRDGVTFEDSQFGLHMRFVFEEMFRVLAPGSIVAIHVQQLNCTKVQHGHMGLRDFVGDVFRLGRRHGLDPHGEIAIPKNPQLIAQRRNLHSLMFKTAERDSRALAPANNDYVLLFRKPGAGRKVRGLGGNFSKEEWIRWARGVWEDVWTPEAQDELEQLEGYREALEVLSEEEWRSSPVWRDILEIDTLDGWKAARGKGDERHVCPLQLEVIRRLLKLYSAEGDLVLDPFMGIGSVACVALELGRRCHRVRAQRELSPGRSGQRRALEQPKASQPFTI